MYSIQSFVSYLESKSIFIARKKTKYFPSFVDELHIQILRESHGVLHIGAHLGQESAKYAEIGTDVLWVEADPETYKLLQHQISVYSNSQKSINALLGEKSHQRVDFYRASNNGQSSSIFKFGEDKFPNVFTSSTIELVSMRLDDLFSESELAHYDHWVIDVQGAELQVLHGAINSLPSCKSLLVEVSRANHYEGGANYEDLCNFLRRFGFKPLWEPQEGFHGNLLFLKF